MFKYLNFDIISDLGFSALNLRHQRRRLGVTGWSGAEVPFWDSNPVFNTFSTPNPLFLLIYVDRGLFVMGQL